jgi:hypothetical protein
MSAMTQGERMVAALSEAGYPPDLRRFEDPVVGPVARWFRTPPLDVVTKAAEICAHDRRVDPAKWEERSVFNVALSADRIADEVAAASKYIIVSAPAGPSGEDQTP